MQTVTSQVNVSAASDIIGALQNILAQSQLIMLDLETPYSQPKLPSTNYFAIELKDHSISDIVAERQQQLDAISAEISSFETARSGIRDLQRQLLKQKKKITKSINLHNRLRSALWRLPTEILSHIFHLCLPDVPGFNTLKPPSQLTAPMLLTRICRRWREVAIGVPSLWRRLSVTVVDSHWQRAAFCYDSYLKRSQGLPLSLALECSKDHSTKIRSLLQPYINQISSLSINCPQAQGLPDQPELLLKDLPVLQELCIGHNNAAFMRLLSQLPSTLRSLKFPATWFGPWLPFHLTAVWVHLTQVEIYVDGQNTFLYLFRLCPNLYSLTTAMASHEIRALRPFTHTKLQHLCIRGSVVFKNPLSGVFGALSLPNLRAFSVCSPSTWPHEEFKAFLTRSKCPLQSLFVCTGSGMLTAEQRAEYYALVHPSKVSQSKAS